MACMDDRILDETIEELIEMKERNLYLNQHTNKIWQSKDTKWRTYIGSGKERKLVKRKTREELDNYIIQYYKNCEQNPTINELFGLWIEYKMETGEIRPGTRDRYVTDFNRFIRSNRLGQTRIRNIDQDVLDIFIRQTIANNTLSAKTYANLRTLIQGIFKYAKRHHMTDISISEFFSDLDISKRIFKTTPRNLETGVFHEDEITKMLTYLYANPTIENLGLIFCFQTGIRRGELVAVKWDDITDGVLHVQRQEVVYSSGVKGRMVHAVVDYTKTEAGNRYIYLPESSQNLLMMLRWRNKTGEYLMEKDGKRIQKTTFDHVILKACDGAGIPRRSMHKIRRTYGTTLIDNNVEDSLIMSQMGHSTIETTRKYYYYANKNDEHKREQINKSIPW